MAGVPAKCTNPTCGLTFVSRAISVSMSIGIQISGNTVSCPRCGGRARVVDGVFNELGRGRLEIVSAPAETRAIFEQLYGVAKRASNGEITPQQAIEEVAKLEPRAVPIFERALHLGLTAFMALITFLMYQIQTQQFELQKEASTSDAQHREHVIGLMEKQLRILEEEHEARRSGDIRTATPATDAKKQPSPVFELTDGERQALKDLTRSKPSKRRDRRQRGKSPNKKDPH